MVRSLESGSAAGMPGMPQPLSPQPAPMPAQMPRIAMVAGETSGDLLAGLLLDGLQERWPGVRSLGIGGAQMQRRGFDAWWPSERLAVHGYSLELVRKLLGIVRIRRQLRERLLEDRPDVFVGVDAPDFNLGLEADLRAAGIPTVHFVCPSIWAWRADRVEKIRRSAGHVLCIFPFEPALLARHGIAATYVGHPLANVIPLVPDRQAARAQLGLGAHDEVLAILPGSRSAEVAYIARPFFQAAALIRKAHPRIRMVVPAVPALHARIEAAVREAGLQDAVTVVAGQSHAVLAACDCTLIASGTATLEAALFKRPMVIAYHMHSISWRLMRRKQLQPWVGLPNILSGEFVVPELLQDAATPEALAAAALRWLEAPAAEREALERRFTALHEELRRDTPRLAADAIQKILAAG
jgi:lipid-A-disaccharide synthase